MVEKSKRENKTSLIFITNNYYPQNGHPKFPTEKTERMQCLKRTLTHPVLSQLATAHCLKILGRMPFKKTGEIMDDDN